MENILSEDILWRAEFIKKYERYLEQSMLINLSALPKNRLPRLELSLDKISYYNSKKGIVHIGLGGVPAESDEELMMWAQYLLGHECQHILSTPDIPWNYGHEEGYRIICRKLSQIIEKTPRHFRKPSDYDKFIKEARELGYGIEKNTVDRLVHFIINAVEDGRIERIRSTKRVGFQNYLITCRGKEWLRCELEDDLKNTIDEKKSELNIILNQILFLSTMRIYQKGFLDVAFDNMHLHDRLTDLRPHIKAGVMSNKCRRGVDFSLLIIEALAEDIIEVAKSDDLENLVNSLPDINNGLSEDGTYSAYDTSLKDEEDGEDEKDVNYFGSNCLDEDIIQGKNDSDKEQEPGAKGDSKDNLDDDNLDSNDSSGRGIDNDKLSDMINQALSMAESKESSRIQSTMQLASKRAEPEIDSAKRSTYKDRSKMPKTPIEKSGVDEPVMPTDLVTYGYDYDIGFVENTRNYDIDVAPPLEITSKGNVLKRKIERIFKNRQHPVGRNKKSGSLDVTKLHKLAMDSIDIFKTNAISEQFDGCAYFLMDNSGSMGNGRYSKRYFCCRALAILETAFTDIMPLKITAFDADCAEYVRHEVVKNWSEKVRASASYNYLEHKESGYGNKDGYSIRIATQELLDRPERHKLLVVLSDGLPSDYHSHTEAFNDVHDAVAFARSKGIEVVSIFFGEDLKETSETVREFRSMYERNCIITEPEYISDDLLRIAKKFALR